MQLSRLYFILFTIYYIIESFLSEDLQSEAFCLTCSQKNPECKKCDNNGKCLKYEKCPEK